MRARASIAPRKPKVSEILAEVFFDYIPSTLVPAKAGTQVKTDPAFAGNERQHAKWLPPHSRRARSRALQFAVPAGDARSAPANGTSGLSASPHSPIGPSSAALRLSRIRLVTEQSIASEVAAERGRATASGPRHAPIEHCLSSPSGGATPSAAAGRSRSS